MVASYCCSKSPLIYLQLYNELFSTNLLVSVSLYSVIAVCCSSRKSISSCIQIKILHNSWGGDYAVREHGGRRQALGFNGKTSFNF